MPEEGSKKRLSVSGMIETLAGGGGGEHVVAMVVFSFQEYLIFTCIFPTFFVIATQPPRSANR